MTKIKICGLRRVQDITAVNIYRPDYAGFVINYPKSHRSIDAATVRNLVRGLDREHVKAVGVFVDADIDEVAELMNDGTLDMAQLHGSESNLYISRLQAMTGKPVIKAFNVKDESDLKKAAESVADHVMLDQGQGSGKTFDWSFLAGEAAARYFPSLAGNGNDAQENAEKWFLAGGLNSFNIEEAIRRFHPYAVDLSSSVEKDGYKDPDRIREIINVVRNTKQKNGGSL